MLLVWLPSWIFKLHDQENFLLQFELQYGFSPVCILLWYFKWPKVLYPTQYQYQSKPQYFNTFGMLNLNTNTSDLANLNTNTIPIPIPQICNPQYQYHTVLHWLPCEALFKPYVLRFKKHCFLALSPKCINRQLVGFSYLTTEYFMKCPSIYPKTLVVEYMMNIFKLFITKLGTN